MLVCHKTTMFAGKMYQRGDKIEDPSIEREIRAQPVVFQHFTPAVHPPDGVAAPVIPPTVRPEST